MMIDMSDWNYDDYKEYAQTNYYNRGRYTGIFWVDNAQYLLSESPGVVIPYYQIEDAEIITETKTKGGVTKTVAGALVGGALLGGIGAIAGAGAGLASGDNEYVRKVYVRVYLTNGTHYDLGKRFLGTDTKADSRKFKEAYAGCVRIMDELQFSIDLLEMDDEDLKAYIIQYHPDENYYKKRRDEEKADDIFEGCSWLFAIFFGAPFILWLFYKIGIALGLG